MTMALKDKPATPFRVPAGIKLVRVNVSTGTRASGSGEGGGVIVEAFKPGTAPPDTYLPPSDSGGGGESGYAGPQAQGVGPGTGGLY